MFNNINLTVTLEEYGEVTTKLIKASDTEFHIAENEYVEGGLYVQQCGNAYILSADINIIPYPYHYFRSFDPVKGIILEFESAETEFKGIFIERFNPFWTKPGFFSDFTEIADNTQQLLTDNNGKYFHIMPVSGKSAIACARPGDDKNVLKITAGQYFGGGTKINAPLLVISVDDNPYNAVKTSFNAAYEAGVIKTPPKENKSYPKPLEGLGWCTWNAFYHDVTASGIEEKLKEFKEKNIPVKWIIIDDGWAKTEDFKLNSCFVDENKFPGGLKKFIEYIKCEYGIEYVGIWHAFLGYWFGIDKNGDEYRKQKNNFIENNSGLVIPSGEGEKAYEFYSGWHKYLKSQGIDFLKVDAQGDALEFMKNTINPCEGIVNLHNALERSVSENFGSVMINCMGLGNINAFSRAFSGVVRNSDDFFPDKEDGFESHIVQNAYNAVFNDNLYFCDYDMWWTKHFSAKQSSVLRAISGGPVYISDEIGNTDGEFLAPVTDENGKVIRCDNAAKPTRDCLFENPHGKVLKIFNTVGESVVIAVFNLSDEKQKTTINLSDVYAQGNFNMHMYFKNVIAPFEDGMVVETEPGDVEIINLSRGEFNNTNKYISVK